MIDIGMAAVGGLLVGWLIAEVKYWKRIRGYEASMKALEKTLQRLQGLKGPEGA